MDPDGLKQLFVSRHSCVRIVTHEEGEVVQMALEAARALNLTAWSWSITTGVRRMVYTDDESIPETSNPAAGLRWLTREIKAPALIILLDLAEQLQDSVNLRAFRDLAESVRDGRTGMSAEDGRVVRSGIVMVDHTDRVPPVVSGASVPFEIAAPDDDEISRIVRATLKSINREGSRKIAISVTGSESRFLDGLVENLRGLNRRQVRQLVSEIAASDREITDDDLERVQRAKRVMLEQAGVLEFVEAPTSMSHIGGLSRLKSWLAARSKSFSRKAADFGLSPPRGVLLLGVQGAGKSLAAKAIATAWRRPLMRLDPGALFDKYIGETERKLREALRQAEAMAPVVLWIDEIEKGFAASAATSSDGGVGRRMFGTLLTWMQEHDAPVFLVATANDIEALPPELLRKGRFDEIFFVDLPNHEARRAIFAIHLKKRKQTPESFDIESLAAATEGYSGAEIEQAVLAAAHHAFSGSAPLTTSSIIEAAKASPPLSVTRRESIESLRAWARGRCVPAE